MADAAANGPIPHLHAVVLAGGSGTRFWPLSRDLNPKQMLSIWGGDSLIVQAVERALPFAGPGHVHILSGERLCEEIRSHLTTYPRLSEADIRFLAEPAARNTAPAIALAAAHLAMLDPGALMLVLPSDHIVESGEPWRETIEEAARAAAGGYLVTVGLQPTSPETGYGYIKAGEELAPDQLEAGTGPVSSPSPLSADVSPPSRARLVERFVEKPDAATAERYLEEGGYLWNSGMLLAKASVVLAELERIAQEADAEDAGSAGAILGAARSVAALPDGEWTTERARQAFADAPSVPFDTAVLELSDRVAVVPSEMDWSDVGTLLSIDRVREADEHGNVIVGRVVDLGSTDSILFSQDRLVATLGLQDALVVDTADATLVAHKSRVQDVRLLVDELRRRGAPEVVAPRSAARPWGSWTVLLKQDGFHIKAIEVMPGRRLSLQSHRHRSEHWVVVSGTARVTRGEEIVEVHANESIYVPMGETHRLENVGKVVLRVIEVAVGEYLEEDDIVRYDDDWGR